MPGRHKIRLNALKQIDTTLQLVSSAAGLHERKRAVNPALTCSVYSVGGLLIIVGVRKNTENPARSPCRVADPCRLRWPNQVISADIQEWAMELQKPRVLPCLFHLRKNISSHQNQDKKIPAMSTSWHSFAGRTGQTGARTVLMLLRSPSSAYPVASQTIGSQRYNDLLQDFPKIGYFFSA